MIGVVKGLSGKPDPRYGVATDVNGKIDHWERLECRESEGDRDRPYRGEQRPTLCPGVSRLFERFSDRPG